MSDSVDFLSVDLSNGRRLRFGSPDDISRWLSEQREAWSWLLQARVDDLGAPFAQLRTSYINAFNGINNRLQNWTRDPDNGAQKQALFDAIQQAYGSNSKVVLPDHSWAQTTRHIAETQGSWAAAAALAYLAKVPIEISNSAAVQGYVTAMLLSEGIDQSSPQLVSNAIRKIADEGNEKSEQRTQEWLRLLSGANEALATLKSSLETQTSDLETKWHDISGRINAEVDTAIKSISNTEAAYKEQMRLQAAVDYWATKAVGHRDAERNAKRYLIWYTVAAPIVLTGLLIALSLSAGAFAQNETAVYLKFAAIGVILTTVAFWVGRVLLRLFLSERHLLADAEERVTLVKTYLALTDSGKVEPTERALVLAPLFRPAADGIVKEEAPDLSIASIVARAIDIKSKA